MATVQQIENGSPWADNNSRVDFETDIQVVEDWVNKVRSSGGEDIFGPLSNLGIDVTTAKGVTEITVDTSKLWSSLGLSGICTLTGTFIIPIVDLSSLGDSIPLAQKTALGILGLGTLALDPLILDLTGNGINLTTLDRNSPYVDYNQNGLALKTSWIGSGTGVLVNLNPDGTYSILGENNANGFVSLASLDLNGDGVINSLDGAYSTLRVWTDDNQDGVINLSELHSLSDLGIASINLNTVLANTALDGDTITQIGSFTMMDGTVRQLAQVNLQASTTYTETINPITISSAIQALPQLSEYGTVPDLHTAMMRDAVLTSMVTNLSANIATMSVADIKLATENILYQWAGVENVDPTSRGGAIDARRLDFLEKYLGQTFTFVGYYSDQIGNPGTLPSLITNQAWLDIEARTIARFLVQSDPTISAEFNLDSTQDLISPVVDIPTSINDMFNSLGAVNSNTLDAWTKVAYVLGTIRQDYGIDDATFAQSISFRIIDTREKWRRDIPDGSRV
jgi:hypothetical protein